MKLLTVIPTQPELTLFLQACRGQGYHAEETTTGKLSTACLRRLDITVACGGLGKAQFAVQTQHLIDSAHWDLVVCAGAAGALAGGLAVGDVVIATETVEHDIRNLFGAPHLPRFPGPRELLEECRRSFRAAPDCRVHFGPIASGDEDVTDPKRRETIRKRTGALVVAWEGAGGARACQFSGVPFVEVRGVTDSADGLAALAFLWNLKRSMKSVAWVVTSLPHFWGGRS
jgi:adenosylhomocysteine nucleosidase